MLWNAISICGIYGYVYIYTCGKNGMTRIPYLCEIRVQVRKAYVYDSCDPCVT